jgi:hypothetical protein
MSDVRRITLDEVVRHFEELEDPRCSIDRKHPLVSVVVIAVLPSREDESTDYLQLAHSSKDRPQ